MMNPSKNRQRGYYEKLWDFDEDTLPDDTAFKKKEPDTEITKFPGFVKPRVKRECPG